MTLPELADLVQEHLGVIIEEGQITLDFHQGRLAGIRHASTYRLPSDTREKPLALVARQA